MPYRAIVEITSQRDLTSPTTRGDFLMFTNDHVDLLISAGVRFQLLSNPDQPGTAGQIARHTAQAIGAQLQNFLAAAEPAAEPAQPYRLQLVSSSDYTPLEAIKATMAVRTSCRHHSDWPASTSNSFTSHLLISAMQHLDGFCEAPWSWRRPHHRQELMIGIHAPGGWIPDVPDITWLDQAALTRQWDEARAVVITAEAALELPDYLPRRPAVFLITDSTIPDHLWAAAERLRPEHILFWPTAREWLLERLRGTTQAIPAPVGRSRDER